MRLEAPITLLPRRKQDKLPKGLGRGCRGQTTVVDKALTRRKLASEGLEFLHEIQIQLAVFFTPI
jgi:hypothetical protein